MPTIRPYTQQVDASASIPSRQAAASDFGNTGLSQLGRAVGSVGQDLAQTLAIINRDEHIAQEKIDQQKKQASHLAIQSKAIEAMQQAQEDLLKRQKEIQPGAPNFTAQTKETERVRAETIVQQAQESPDGSPPVIRSEDLPYLQLELQRNTAQIMGHASSFESQALAAHTKEQYNGTLELQRNIVQADPTLLQSELERAYDRIDRMDAWSGQVKEAEHNRTRQFLSGGAIDGRIDALVPTPNVEAIRAMRDELTAGDSKWKVQLDPKDYAHALDRLTALEQHALSQRSVVMMDAVNERIREARTGVVNGLSLQEAETLGLPPEQAYLKKKDIASALIAGEAIRLIGPASHEQRLSMVNESLRQLATPGRYDQDAEKNKAIVSAFQDQLQAIKQDVAAVALRSEPVKAAYDAMTQEATPASVDAYVLATRAEQQRIAPWQTPRLLSEGQVGQIKAVMAAIPNSPDGAEQAFRAIGSEYQRWGQHWPEVYRQLAQEKALSDTQIAAARMASDPTKHADMRVLLATSTMKPNELEALLPKGAGQRLDEAIQSEMLPVRAGLALQVNGVHELDRQTQAVKTLALGYLLRDQSLTESAAAARAAQTVVKGDFHWQGSYFVPKQYNPDQIAAGTKTVMQQLPETIVKPADLAGMRPGDSTAAMRDALRSGGQWVTNDAGTGLVLTWPNAAREAVMVEGIPTHTAEGRPILRLPGGDIETEKTITVTDPRINGGQATNIPSIYGGKHVSEDEAIQIIAKNKGVDPDTKQPMVGYPSIAEAERAAVARSAELGRKYAHGQKRPLELTWEQLKDAGTPSKDFFGRKLK